MTTGLSYRPPTSRCVIMYSVRSIRYGPRKFSKCQSITRFWSDLFWSLEIWFIRLSGSEGNCNCYCFVVNSQNVKVSLDSDLISSDHLRFIRLSGSEGASRKWRFVFQWEAPGNHLETRGASFVLSQIYRDLSWLKEELEKRNAAALVASDCIPLECENRWLS